MTRARGAPAARGAEVEERLREVHRDIAAFRPRGFGPPVHGPAVASRIFLLGQAPGPHEARLGRPFAWTAGKTLFRWLERATGADEEQVRARIYIAAVARCFPGKTTGGGDRVPTPAECALWREFIAREIEILRPRLVLPVGRLAIQEVLGRAEPLAGVIGRAERTEFHGVEVDVIPLPHPSGASTWFKVEPGRTLLEDALRLVAAHEEVLRTFRRAPVRLRQAGAALAVALAAACAHAPPPGQAPPERGREAPPAGRGELGLASFYGARFHGRRTASGERYDMHALTCAHPTAPFGTRLRVTELEGGRSVVVTVTDRGPFARGRIVDVSLAAARKLGMVRRGLVQVRVERAPE